MPKEMRKIDIEVEHIHKIESCDQKCCQTARTKIKVNFRRSKKRFCEGFNNSALPIFHYLEPLKQSNEEFPIIETDDSEDENSIEFEDLTKSKRLSKLYENLVQSQIGCFYNQLNRKLLIENQEKPFEFGLELNPHICIKSCFSHTNRTNFEHMFLDFETNLIFSKTREYNIENQDVSPLESEREKKNRFDQIAKDGEKTKSKKTTQKGSPKVQNPTPKKGIKKKVKRITEIHPNLSSREELKEPKPLILSYYDCPASNKCPKWRNLADVNAHMEIYHRIPLDIFSRAAGIKIVPKIFK